MISVNFLNVKEFLKKNKTDLFIAASFFLIALISFGLGRLSILLEKQDKIPIRIEENAFLPDISNHPKIEALKEQGIGASNNSNAALLYIGSKNGSVYHLPHCSGAKRIAEENKIWFSSKEEAESLGYRPAKNCEGL